MGLKTQTSRQYLYETSATFCSNKNSLSNNANYDACGKRKRKYDIAKEPSCHIEKFDCKGKGDFIRSEFFSGKRKTLTNELEDSRNRLRTHRSDMFRILKTP